MLIFNLFIAWAIYSLHKGKKPSNALYCGLVGYCGDRPADPNKIRLLQLYNVSRGEHATGISIDNEIFKDAIPATKFLAERRDIYDLIPDAKMFTIIGHDRQASSGSKDKPELAHPFIEEKTDGKGSMILAHNGTIQNISSIGQKYKVDHSLSTSSDSWTLTKVLVNLKDEEILEVLKGYTGFANLLFYRTTMKNTLFVHKDPDRPLFAYRESPTQMYISSILESLVAIGGTKETLTQFEPYTVYKIVKGMVVKTWSTAERKPIQWESPKVTHYSNKRQSRGENDWQENYSNFHEGRKPFNDFYKVSEGNKAKGGDLQIISNGFQYRDDSYYYNNGHRFTGVMYINTLTSEWTANETEGFTKFYFVMGIVMRDEKAYNDLYRAASNGTGAFDQTKWHKDIACVDVSKYAEFPVKSNVNGVVAGTIYYPMAYHHEKYGNHKKSNIVFTPPLSLHTYCVTKQGVLMSHTTSDGPLPKEKRPIIPPKPMTVIEGLRKTFKSGQYTDIPTLFKAVLVLMNRTETDKIFEEFCTAFTELCVLDGVIQATDAVSLTAAFDYSNANDTYDGLNSLLEAYNVFLHEDEVKSKENELTIELHIQDLQRANPYFNRVSFIGDINTGLYKSLEDLIIEYALTDDDGETKPVLLAVALELHRLAIISPVEFAELEQAKIGDMFTMLSTYYEIYITCIDTTPVKEESVKDMTLDGNLQTADCCTVEDNTLGAILFRKYLRVNELENLKRPTVTEAQWAELATLKASIHRILENPDLIDAATLQMKYGISLYTIIEEYKENA